MRDHSLVAGDKGAPLLSTRDQSLRSSSASILRESDARLEARRSCGDGEMAGAGFRFEIVLYNQFGFM